LIKSNIEIKNSLTPINLSKNRKAISILTSKHITSNEIKKQLKFFTEKNLEYKDSSFSRFKQPKHKLQPFNLLSKNIEQ
jgi:hypothetical protein